MAAQEGQGQTQRCAGAIWVCRVLYVCMYMYVCIYVRCLLYLVPEGSTQTEAWWSVLAGEVGVTVILLYSILYTLYSILYTLYSILYTLYSILYTLYSILYTLYSILYTLYSNPTLPYHIHACPVNLYPYLYLGGGEVKVGSAYSTRGSAFSLGSEPSPPPTPTPHSRLRLQLSWGFLPNYAPGIWGIHPSCGRL